MGYPSSGGMSDGGEVKMRFPRRRAKTADSPAADDPSAWPGPPRLADRSCCCPARPVIRVLIPPGPARPYSADLLLCGHHYLASRAALAAVGAEVIEETGAMADPVLAGCRGSRA
jgi:hypothetical protein